MRRAAVSEYRRRLQERLARVYGCGDHELFLGVLSRIGPSLGSDDSLFGQNLLNRLFAVPGLLKSESQM